MSSELGQVCELLNGVVGAREAQLVRVPTANPINFAAVLGPDNPTELLGSLEIEGVLAFPAGELPHPVVVIVPGSAGVSPNHVSHAQTLLGCGLAVLLLDPFGARSVTSTVANQTQYSFAASAVDVLAALQMLAGDARVDAARISAQGHSRGGAAVIMAGMRQLADRVVGDLAFAGVYAAYPWCGQQFRHPTVGRTAVRAIVGVRDEWCSVSAIQSQIHAISLLGGDASVRVVADAHHSFDRDADVFDVPEARVSPNAPIEYIDDRGTMISALSDGPDPNRTDADQFREAVAHGFGQRGARMGGGPGLKDLFVADMIAFHRSVLKLA